ncbi:MAG: hypothetical protein QW230_00465 [Thermofilum sp.]
MQAFRVRDRVESSVNVVELDPFDAVLLRKVLIELVDREGARVGGSLMIAPGFIVVRQPNRYAGYTVYRSVGRTNVPVMDLELWKQGGVVKSVLPIDETEKLLNRILQVGVAVSSYAWTYIEDLDTYVSLYSENGSIRVKVEMNGEVATRSVPRDPKLEKLVDRARRWMDRLELRIVRHIDWETFRSLPSRVIVRGFATVLGKPAYIVAKHMDYWSSFRVVLHLSPCVDVSIYVFVDLADRSIRPSSYVATYCWEDPEEVVSVLENAETALREASSILLKKAEERGDDGSVKVAGYWAYLLNTG